MSLHITLVRAVLTHDTDTFSNMVPTSLLRILMSYSNLEMNKRNQKSKVKEEKSLFLINILLSITIVINLKSLSWIVIHFLMIKLDLDKLI